ncbi:MAG: site-2 protease family protein, partial [Clostridia bacterium]|nr:site-2 protease family protein [Clostridia bacterium]
VIGILVMVILVATQEGLLSNKISLLPTNDNGVNYAYEGGLRVGDEFYAVEGTRVHIINETFYEIRRKGIEPIDITVIRDGEKITLEDVVFPTFEEQGITFGTMDFKVDYEEKSLENVLKHGFFRSTSTIKIIWESLVDLVTGRYGMNAVSGPIGVTQALGEAAEQGLDDLVYLAVIISMNLGVMNLLPLPALDGGRLLFQFIELVARRPIKREIEGYIHFAGLVLLMILMVVIAVKDVIVLF